MTPIPGGKATPEKPSRQRTKGSGSVFWNESKKRWEATLAVPSADGVRRRKTITSRVSKKDAEVKLNGLVRQLQKDGDIPTNTQTFGSWLDVYFTTIGAKKWRPKTAATYRTLIEGHIKPAIGHIQLAKLTDVHIRQVEDRIVRNLGLSSTTAAQAYRIMSVALKYAERQGRVTRNVAKLTDAPRKARRTLTILSADHAIKVLQTVADDRLRSRWAAAFYTGARQGELLGLEIDRVTDRLDLSWQLQRLSWEHGCHPKTPECGNLRGAECPARKVTKPADWEFRYLTGGYWLSRPKSEKGKRPILLVEPLRGMIEHRLLEAATEPNPHGLLWTAAPKTSHGRTNPLDGLPIDPSWDNKEWHRILARADVPDARLHDARHTTASLFRKAGVPIGTITQVLGHSTHAMSEAYIDTDDDVLRAAMGSLSAQLRIGAAVPPVLGIDKPV